MTDPKASTQVKYVLFGLAVFYATACPADSANSKHEKWGSLTKAENEDRSTDDQNILAWVVDSGNNGGMPFIVLDKKEAMV